MTYLSRRAATICSFVLAVKQNSVKLTTNFNLLTVLNREAKTTYLLWIYFAFVFLSKKFIIAGKVAAMTLR